MKIIIISTIITMLFISCKEEVVEYNNKKIMKWREVTQNIINSSDSLEIKDLHTMTSFAYANALINGWNHPKTKVFLNQAYSSIENNSYGLEYAWDAFQDGTINPKSTNYTVTITDHVGLVFLEGFKNNVIEKEKIDSLYEALKKIPS